MAARDIHLRIYRYDPESTVRPTLQDFNLARGARDLMLLDLLLRIKHEQDDSLALRCSCREGVCGSDALNINGWNGLACVTRVDELKQPIVVRPLPGFPVIRDLVVDLTAFWYQYHSIKPWLVNDTTAPEKERLQSPAQRDRLDGLYECILCACCSSQCPTYWWNPDKFVGPAGLLQAMRFMADSRDTALAERLDNLDDAYRLFRCRTILNCTNVCPKNLNPASAISEIRTMLAQRSV